VVLAEGHEREPVRRAEQEQSPSQIGVPMITGPPVVAVIGCRFDSKKPGSMRAAPYRRSPRVAARQLKPSHQIWKTMTPAGQPKP
jgi:hypothetical protein